MTSDGYVFVLLTDSQTNQRLALRIDEIVAIVPWRKREGHDGLETLVALVHADAVMVTESTDEVMELMAKAFRPFAELQ